MNTKKSEPPKKIVKNRLFLLAALLTWYSWYFGILTTIDRHGNESFFVCLTGNHHNKQVHDGLTA